MLYRREFFYQNNDCCIYLINGCLELIVGSETIWPTVCIVNLDTSY